MLQQASETLNFEPQTVLVLFCWKLNPLNRAFEKWLIPQLIRNSPLYIKPEGALPCSQELTRCLYHEPDGSSLHPSHRISLWSIIILSSPLCLSLPSCALFFFFQLSPPKPCMHFPRICHISSEEYESSDSSLCSFLQSPVTFLLVGPDIFITLFRNTPSLWPSRTLNTKLHTHRNQQAKIMGVEDQVTLHIFYLNINQLDALNFTMSLVHASTCFEHMCSLSGGQNCTIQPLVSSHL